MTDKKVRVGVIGVGHLGKQHARVYATTMPHVELAYVCDVELERAKEVASQFNAQHTNTYQDVHDVDAVSVVVPTKYHFSIAKYFLEHGISVLIEKPMTATVREAQELVSLANSQSLVLQPGFVERFNPAVMAVKKYIENPKYIEALRISPFRFRSSDIGAVMDIMIHDLDIVCNLAQSEVCDISAIGVNVITDFEDIVNARLTFANGCVANLTASRVSVKTKREIRIFQKDAYFSIDYGEKVAKVYRKPENFSKHDIEKLVRELSQQDAASIATLQQYIRQESIAMDDHEPLQAELLAFVEAIHNRNSMQITGEDGLHAVSLAERIQQLIK